MARGALDRCQRGATAPKAAPDEAGEIRSIYDEESEE